MSEKIKLTTLTKGGGCGCKIPPASLKEILKGQVVQDEFGILIGNSTADDAAVYDLGNGDCLISTTDFFTPIVDDPFDFGRIAAANSISDIYAMGGRPVMALSILAWPTDKIPLDVAADVIRGARSICDKVGIAIAGGHSIENPEPVFGLAVTGLSRKEHIKKNNSASIGDILLLTKPLGVGILATAMKRNLLTSDQTKALLEELVKLNSIGEKLGEISAVHAMTDVTGFGLIGHLLEMTDTNNLAAEIVYDTVPIMKDAKDFIAKFIYPDNTMKNWKYCNGKVNGISGESLLTLCDPQTNGGLLVAVDRDSIGEVEQLLKRDGQFYARIGELKFREYYQIDVV